jgi:hypothetical protein
MFNIHDIRPIGLDRDNSTHQIEAISVSDRWFR